LRSPWIRPGRRRRGNHRRSSASRCRRPPRAGAPGRPTRASVRGARPPHPSRAAWGPARPTPVSTPRRPLDLPGHSCPRVAGAPRLDYAAPHPEERTIMLAVARRLLPKIPAVQGTIEELPYATGCFDAIVCCGSTLSFASDATRALREFGRVLRPDGLLLLECEHRGRLDLAWALVNSVTGDRLGYGLTPTQAWRQIVGNGADGVWTEYPGYGPMRLFR